MTEPLLSVEGLSKGFGAVAASDNLSFAVREGEIHAVIGPNGAGKTTLVAQLSGEIAPDQGVIRFAGENITALSVPARVHLGLARSFQITSIFPQYTALRNVMLAVQSRQGHAFRFFRQADRDETLLGPARALLARVGLAELADRRAYALAHGQQRQLELAMALALEPRLLLLDEPMAGMGREESEAVIALLAALKGKITILLVEHDMDAVFTLADTVTVLVYGRAIATGTPDTIRADPEVRTAYLGEEG